MEKALVVGAVLSVALSMVGFWVGAARYVIDPPPPQTGPCATCVELQLLWNSMTFTERCLCGANFAAASAVCFATGCGWLNLFVPCAGC